MLATLRANIAATLLGLLAAIFLIVAIIQTIRIDGLLWIDGANDKLERVTRDNNELRFAAKEAERKNAEQVARIEADQERVNADIEARYRADRERLRRELADGLRRKADQGSAGRSEAGPDGPPAERIDDPASVCIPTSDYVRGAETELQLDTLITWIEEQLRVQR